MKRLQKLKKFRFLYIFYRYDSVDISKYRYDLVDIIKQN